MIPILSQLLCDNESLFEYERYWGTSRQVSIGQVQRRLIALERQNAPLKHDSYYEGLAKNALAAYRDLPDLIGGIPYDLAKEYLISVNHELYVKADRFTEWMELIKQFPPLLLISAFFADKFTSALQKDRRKMMEFANCFLKQFKHTVQLLPYIPAFNYIMEKEGGLNDLHLHLNGTTETDVLWNLLLRSPYKMTKDYQDAYESKAAVRKLSEQIISDFTPLRLYERMKQAADLRGRLITQIAISNGLIKEEEIIKREKDYSSPVRLRNLWGDFGGMSETGMMIDELLFCLCVMSEMRNYHDTKVAGMFHHYLLIKGMVHRFVVMQRLQVGFPQFQLLTENSFRWHIEEFYEKRFLQLAGCNFCTKLALIEGRFSPKNSSVENSLLVSRIRRGFEEAKRKSEFLKDTDLRLIAHFIKRPEKAFEKKFNIRSRFLRKELKRKAIALAVFLKESPDNKQYVVGVDAAASEFDAGPEVFAQTYRFLRNQGVKHFTFHAGEDFSHLVSGLRTIVEAVIFLDLWPGDRLGHCTAIGISPDLWIRRIGKICYLPQGEWLDDLVFVWKLIRESKHEGLQHLVLPLESEIAEYSYKVYGKYYLPYLLSKAWEYRQYDPFLLLEKGDMRYDSWYSNYSYEQYNDIQTEFGKSGIKPIIEAYHASTNGRKYLGDTVNSRKNYDEVIEIETDKLFSSDVLGIIQLLILEYLAKKEIVIEALPTSNLCISHYQHLKEYHLEKWLEVDEEKRLLPSVVLGSDDPGIFMTNIYNEYALVYMHLETCNCSASRKMEKILNLHSNSNIYKFCKDDKR